MAISELDCHIHLSSGAADRARRPRQQQYESRPGHAYAFLNRCANGLLLRFDGNACVTAESKEVPLAAAGAADVDFAASPVAKSSGTFAAVATVAFRAKICSLSCAAVT